MSYPLDPGETIEMLSTRVGTWAEGKGFREDWLLAEKLEDIARTAESCDFGHTMYADSDMTMAQVLFVAAKVLRNNVVGTKLMLMVTELAEAMESLRNTGVEAHFEGEGNIIEELADTEIRIKDTAHMLGGGLGKSEIDKIRTNDNRPYKHGRQL